MTMSAHNRERRLGKPPSARPTAGLPTALEPGRGLPEPVEIDPGDDTRAWALNEVNGHLKAYRLGECTVLVTREYGTWHLSIAHPRRLPTWDEIALVRYRLLPEDATIALVLPPLEQYVNLHPNCFQLNEIPPIPDMPEGT